MNNRLRLGQYLPTRYLNAILYTMHFGRIQNTRCCYRISAIGKDNTMLFCLIFDLQRQGAHFVETWEDGFAFKEVHK